MNKNQRSKDTSFALISVFDKTGILDLAKTLVAKNVQIISTGGTAKYLEENKIKTIPIEEITKMPESFDGRMKTISFQIASGILFDRQNKSHVSQAETLQTPNIDYIVCNFYDFWKKPGIEMIDVGGPTMVRAAAKNYQSVTVLVKPQDYPVVIEEIKAKGTTSEELRKVLASTAFSYVAEYDSLIANYFQNELSGTDWFITLRDGKRLRYGENPHQEGEFYKDIENTDPLGLGNFDILQGKEISFSNYLDLDGGLQAISCIGQEKPACVILKHTNPCGAALGKDLKDAFHKAWFDGDPLAAFGGIIFFNRPVDGDLAEYMLADRKFFEIIAAPEFTKEAKELFTSKPNLRLLENKELAKPRLHLYKELKRIRGGFLVQDTDVKMLDKKALNVVTKKKPSAKQISDMLFAWELSRVSKSNCVVAVKDEILLASGVGQQDRKRCCELCVSKAIKPLKGAVAATDGFFPFRDGPDVLIKAGITAIIQPGGSIRDQETIDACNEAGVAMIMTGVRAFKH